MVAEACLPADLSGFKARYDYPNKSCINATQKSIKFTPVSGRLATILFSTWSDGDSGFY